LLAGSSDTLGNEVVALLLNVRASNLSLRTSCFVQPDQVVANHHLLDLYPHVILFNIPVGSVQLFNREEELEADGRSAKVCHDRLEAATTGIGDEGLEGDLETFEGGE